MDPFEPHWSANLKTMFSHDKAYSLKHSHSGSSQTFIFSLAGWRIVLSLQYVLVRKASGKTTELRGLLFKFVGFLYSRSELLDRVIKLYHRKIYSFPYHLMYKA